MRSSKTLVTRILKELSEDLSSIKKVQSEMKHTLIETTQSVTDYAGSPYLAGWGPQESVDPP